MSLLTQNILPSIKLNFSKSRPDGYTDQFNRVFMVKICLATCVILGLNWFKDSIGCIIPETSGMDKGYVTQACWIQGVYVYRDGWKEDTIIGSRYYGIPKELKLDGTNPNTGELCSVSTEKEHGCEPMMKVFYLQFQWFPFFMGAIATLYYLPYIFYRYVNGDIINLKLNIKEANVNVDDIIKNYFNYQINPRSQMTYRLIGNVFGKILYIMVNVIAFVATDSLINNDFKSYGRQMISWNKESNDVKLDYTSTRTKFRAGDKLLPSFGICEVLELSRDIKHTLYNKHKYICEISQNILYQYILVLLWFLYVAGIVISIVGLIRMLVDLCISRRFGMQGIVTKKDYVCLTVRECQYLEYIKNKKITVYHEVVKKLSEERTELAALLPEVPQDPEKV